MNECSACGLDFATVPSFDDHRVGTFDYTYLEGLRLTPPQEDGRRCLNVEEMEEQGWRKNRFGRWLSPNSVSEPLLARVRL